MGTHFAFERGRARSLAGARALRSPAARLRSRALSHSGCSCRASSGIYSVPAEHGWPWDIVIGNVNFDLTAGRGRRAFTQRRSCRRERERTERARHRRGRRRRTARDQRRTEPRRRRVVEGRVPTSPNEIALGRRMMRRAGLEIGDTVTLSVAGSEFEREDTAPTDHGLVIVGASVTPILGEADIGEGGIVTLDAIAAAGRQRRSESRPRQLRTANADDDAVAARLAEGVPFETMTDTVPARRQPLPSAPVAVAGSRVRGPARHRSCWRSCWRRASGCGRASSQSCGRWGSEHDVSI